MGVSKVEKELKVKEKKEEEEEEGRKNMGIFVLMRSAFIMRLRAGGISGRECALWSAGRQ
jgi:hypothetical protein